MECYKCGKLGHFQFECPNLEDKVANYAGFDDEEEMLLMAVGDSKNSARSEVWFLDSGCSNHMCGNKSRFFDLDVNFRETVKLGNDSRLNAMGKGKIKIEIEGHIQIVSDVYYIPGLRSNLFSIGLTVIFENNQCKVIHAKRGLLMTSYMASNRMFLVKGTPVVSNCMHVTTDADTILWHKRYAHLSYSGLKLLK